MNLINLEFLNISKYYHIYDNYFKLEKFEIFRYIGIKMFNIYIIDL
jgi:hypothetical protein